MPNAKGAHFHTTGGEIFYPVATIDAEGEGGIPGWGFAIIAAAWGQDSATSDGESAVVEIDMGIGIPNGIPFNTKECVDLTYQLNNDGLYDVCEELSYTVSIQISGALPFSANTILITDTLAKELDYI